MSEKKAGKAITEDRGGIVTARGTGDGLVVRLDGRVHADSLIKAVKDFSESRKTFLAGNEVSLEWVGKIPNEVVVNELSTMLKDDYSIVVKASRLVDLSVVSAVAGSGSNNSQNVRNPSVRVLNKLDKIVSATVEQDLTQDSQDVDSTPSLFDGIESIGGVTFDDSLDDTSLSTDLDQIDESKQSEFTRDERPKFTKANNSKRGETRRENSAAYTAFNRQFEANNFSEMLETSQEFAEDTLLDSKPLSQDTRAALSALAGGKLRTGVIDPLAWDDPDARMIYGTLRSGQRVESEHSVVIIGDVNAGAEVVAGGDIIVLGVLRGVAHAGAYDETGGGRVIIALNLQASQLRIGLVISRGSEDLSSNEQVGSNMQSGGEVKPELARIEGNLIVLESFGARGFGPGAGINSKKSNSRFGAMLGGSKRR